MNVLAAGTAPIRTPSVDILGILPIIALSGAALAVILARALLRQRPHVVVVGAVLGLLGVLGAAVGLAFQWDEVSPHTPITTIAEMVRVDEFAVFLGAVIVAATFLALLLSAAYLRREGLDAPEYLALVLLSAAGMLAMVCANDLIVVFVALEVLSIPLYVLAAFDRRRLSSQEAGLKYFVLGAFSSALFLYGIALTYGGTGTTSLTGIRDFLQTQTLFDEGTLVAGMGLLVVGLGFKIAAVPFHLWTPDVYQGSPTPITAFMAAATKAAGFAALLRVFGFAFPTYRTDWRPVVFVLAVLSMLVGSLLAVVQTDLKRVLAYSSIAHAGYVLIGFQVHTPRGQESALFYLLTYAFMAIGAFAVLTVATRTGDDDHALDDYRGLAVRRPVLGGLLVFFLLAQAGVPLTGGFVAKLEVFSAAAQADAWALLVVGVLSAVVGAFFYLRVVLSVLTPPEGAERAFSGRQVDLASAFVLVACVAVVLFVGVAPDTILDWARDATFLT